MRRTIIAEALEALDSSLAIVDLVNREEAANKSGNFSELESYKQALTKESKTPLPDGSGGSSSSSSGSGSGDGDGGSDDDPFGFDDDSDTEDDGDGVETSSGDDAANDENADSDKDADKEDKEASDETAVATEALRNDRIDYALLARYESVFANEDFNDVANAVGRGLFTGASYAADKLKDFVIAAGKLGIHVTPIALRKVKVGVIYLFTRTIATFLKTFIALANFRKKFVMRISKRKDEIASLKEAIAKLRNVEISNDYKTKVFSKDEVISAIVADDETGIQQTAKCVSQFVGVAIDEIDLSIDANVKATQSLIEAMKRGVRGELINYMRVNPLGRGFIRRSVRGYVKTPELVENYTYSGKLPSRAVFIATVPNSSLTEVDEVGNAYQASGFFLGVNDRVIKMPDTLNYVDIDTLDAYLDQLAGICEQVSQHDRFFDSVRKAAENLKMGYRNYYQSLVESSEQKTIRETLVQYIYQKQEFVTRVYAPGAMDVHDFVASYLSRSIQFARDNVKVLTAAVKAE